jgi:peptide-methionine (R)-S-oxide reductase
MRKDPALQTSTPDAMTDDDWRVVLRPEEFAILRQASTERPWTGPHLEESRPGAYHCAGCGAKLYAGQHKFHSGCGWPSFYQEVEPGALETVVDSSYGMVRTEMRCASCHGHLGHIFDDAPKQPTGMRHCVNGYALVFVPDGVDPQQALAAHRAGG